MKEKNFPRGFKATGLNCEIKKDKLDLAIIISETAANAAVVYTNNIFKAAPLQVTQNHLKEKETAKAIIINSGVANAAMGKQGVEDAIEVSKALATTYNLEENDVIIASTGIIGIPLPVDKIKNGIMKSQESLDFLQKSYQDVETAILTTDTVPKECCETIEIDGQEVHLWGIAKGSGMIHPNMSTMLGFICTDVQITTSLLQEALTNATNESFNMISVDGDTSTNDMVAVLANGQAKNDQIISRASEQYYIFYEALKKVCQSLAKQIVADGEGATKMFSVQVKGTSDSESAKLIARAVASSSLVKAAIFGKDANWGRIACAAGYSGASFNPEQMNIFIGDLMVAKEGQGLFFDEALALEKLSEKEIDIIIELNEGNAAATAWGCDLTYDYVTINADYRS